MEIVPGNGLFNVNRNRMSKLTWTIISTTAAPPTRVMSWLMRSSQALIFFIGIPDSLGTRGRSLAKPGRDASPYNGSAVIQHYTALNLAPGEIAQGIIGFVQRAGADGKVE